MTELSALDDATLIDLKIALEVELAKRSINFSVGIVGERAAIEFFNSTPGLPNLIPAPVGAKNVDALSRDGDRYSIKSIQKAKKTGTIYPDAGNPDKQLFEFLLLVALDRNYSVRSIHRFSWKQFLAVRAWDRRMNAWYIPASVTRIQQGESLFDSTKESNH